MKIKFNEGQIIMDKLIGVYDNGEQSKSIRVVTFIDAKKIKSIFQIYKDDKILMSTSSVTEAEAKYNSLLIKTLTKEEVSNDQA